MARSAAAEARAGAAWRSLRRGAGRRASALILDYFAGNGQSLRRAES
jgi:hypothetical protein